MALHSRILEQLKRENPDIQRAIRVKLVQHDRKTFIRMVSGYHALQLAKTGRWYFIDGGGYVMRCRHIDANRYVSEEVSHPIPSGYRQTGRNFEAVVSVMVARWEQERISLIDGIIGSHTLAEWNEVCERFHWRCVRCHAPHSESPLTKDHVVPVSCGGVNFISNIQPLCRPCNSWKHAREIDFRATFLRSFKPSI